MKRGGSKQKGGAFERWCCKHLSLWVSHGRKEDVFWRSAMSGGRATVGGRKGKDLARQAGDITAVASEGHTLTNHYYIECKHVRDLCVHGLWLKYGKLFGFWRIACTEARKHRRMPMLIARQNNYPTLVLIKQGARVFPERLRLANVQTVGCDVYLFDDVMQTEYGRL